MKFKSDESRKKFFAHANKNKFKNKGQAVGLSFEQDLKHRSHVRAIKDEVKFRTNLQRLKLESTLPEKMKMFEK